jgi:hypothetical protein
MKISLGRSMRRWEENIKIYPKEVGWEGLFGSVLGPVNCKERGWQGEDCFIWLRTGISGGFI